MTVAYKPFDGDAWLDRGIPLAGGPYRVLPESAFDTAEAMAFVRQGRKARVFKVQGPDGKPYALKAFHRGFSLPEYGPITNAQREFSDIPGLRAGQRRLVGAEEAMAIGEPGLTHAVLMPWIEGVAWAGVVETRVPLPEQTCLTLARQTATTLTRLEARRVAHADVSSSNVLVTASAEGPAIELIDVEDMYHESFGPLPHVPDGSPGYAHPANHGLGCRTEFGDRFAGAILLTEMLAWPDPRVRRSAADVSVFDQSELCRDGVKYTLVHSVVSGRSPEAAALLARAWASPGLLECPRLDEWAAALTTIPAVDGDHPHATPGEEPAVACPGCGRPIRAEADGADHGPACPLRPARARSAVADKSSFPGVPEHDAIGFVPLFPPS